jgi:sigma-B regulation protein RsbU (phosphoserine phosphatase)
MSSINQAFESSKARSRRIYRWVTVWLSLSAAIALLLLANSIRDYFFVARLIATQQIRHEMSQRAAALEHQLRQDPKARASAFTSLMEAGGHAVWTELRSNDGSLLEHAGASPQRPFSDGEYRRHARNHEPLYKVVTTANGDVVVEVFPIRAPANPLPASPAFHAEIHAGPPSPMMLEMAMPLSDVDQSNFWPIRRNLFINCSGALALLVTVVVAGFAFRSYAHGKHLEEQLEIARQVQSELLPSLTKKYNGVDLATEYTPAEQVGGDFYDVFQVKNVGTALVMGDVSGKGVPAALLTGVIHGAVRSSLWFESPALHESESQELNRLLCESASQERYASMFWCYYDPSVRSLNYVNAGHCPPLLVRGNGSGVEISSLREGGPVLGMLPDAQYEHARVEVSAGDILVMYSDGLVEAANSHGEEYGEDRLREVLATGIEKSADAIRRSILNSLAAFSGASKLRDDLTIVVAHFVPVWS